MADIEDELYEDEAFRDRISTVDEHGRRVWVFPKKPSGKWTRRRQYLSYALLLILFGLPFIKLHGEPLLMLNILERKFIIFGYIFWPQDLYLFALGMIIGVVFIIFFTVIYGRLFCGWICPQTIFMEMVFRRIEYAIDGDFRHQKKLREGPWNAEKIRKRVLKHSIFWLFSFLTANIFLSYIIGVDELFKIVKAPTSEYLGGFIGVVIFSTVFYYVFAQLREQVCTTICPYGRLQSVLLDENSMVIAYDHVRGENRGRFRKNEDRAIADKGDCIDCYQCVHVCPTGIDIRNGTQLECINCTACIDACDHIMDSIGLPPGLIRFVSEKGIQERTGFEWTPRVKAYSALLTVLVAVLIGLLVTREDFDSKIMRQSGSTFMITKDGDVSNIFEIYLLNKTRNEFDIQLELDSEHGTIETTIPKLYLPAEQELKERFIIKIPYSEVSSSEVLYINVYGNGKKIQRVKTKFIGPIQF